MVPYFKPFSLYFARDTAVDDFHPVSKTLSCK